MDELLEQARKLFDEGNYQGVIDLLPEEVLQVHKSDALYVAKARAYYFLKEYDLCLEAAKKALVINPKNASAHNSIGNVYVEKRQYEMAIEEYNKAITYDPRLSYQYSNLGNAYYGIIQYEKAIEAYKEAITINPENPYPYNGLGNVYKELKQYKKAIEAYNKAIEIDQKFSNPYNGLGNVYQELEQYEEAIGVYKEAIKLDPKSSIPHNGLGNVYHDLKQYEKAIEAYYDAINIDPTFPYPYNGLGNAYFGLKQFKKAIKAYEKAIKIDPAFSHPFNGLGNTYDALKQYDKSIEAYNTAIRIDATIPYQYYNRALSYFDQRKYEQALIDFKKYIELPEDKTNYNTSVAEDKITDIEKIINIKGYKNIKHLVDDINNLLLYNEKLVTHYTTMTVAKALVLDKDSKFRLSEAAYLNDTSEGKELFNFLSNLVALEDEQYKIKEKFIKKPFIGSFVAEEKENDLTLWRMYGKEDREEAKGCSITMRRKEFINSLMESLKKNKKEDALRGYGEFTFYRVAYMKKDKTKPFTIPSGKPRDEKKLNTLMTKLSGAVKDFGDEHTNNDDNMQTLLEKLNKIAYLFKTYDYQYEHEIRLVLNGTGFPKIVDAKFTPPKVYIELVNIMPVITKITLGPKVERAEEWVTAFHYGLKNEGYSADITKSDLPFK